MHWSMTLTVAAKEVRKSTLGSCRKILRLKSFLDKFVVTEHNQICIAHFQADHFAKFLDVLHEPQVKFHIDGFELAPNGVAPGTRG